MYSVNVTYSLPPNSDQAMIYVGGQNCAICHNNAADCMGVCTTRTVVTQKNHHVIWIGWQQGCKYTSRIGLLKQRLCNCEVWINYILHYLIRSQTSVAKCSWWILLIDPGNCNKLYSHYSWTWKIIWKNTKNITHNIYRNNCSVYMYI